MNNWQTGLCGCFDDCGICCYGCWCTARLYAKNAQQIDGSDYDDAYYTYFNSGQDACAWVPVTENRRALREKYGLPEEPCDDCTVIFFCAPCAVCQTARELKIRNTMPGETQGIFITSQPANNSITVQPVASTEPVRFVQPQ